MVIPDYPIPLVDHAIPTTLIMVEKIILYFIYIKDLKKGPRKLVKHVCKLMNTSNGR